MSNFVVHLGSGIYIDDVGNVTTGPSDGATQVYEPPEDMQFDPMAIAGALKEIAGLLGDEKTEQKIKGLASPELMSFLLKAASVGAAAASIASVYFAVAAGLLFLFERLSTDDKRLSADATAVIDAVLLQVKAADDENLVASIKHVRKELAGRLDDVRGKLSDIEVQGLRGADRVAAVEAIDARLAELATVLRGLETQQWSPMAHHPSYFRLFGVSQWLKVPSVEGDRPLYKLMDEARWFDYRLGVPLLLYVAAAYPALLRATEPGFRSRGSFAPVLREVANTIDRFVTRMCNESFARTVWDFESFAQNQMQLDFEGSKLHLIVEPWIDTTPRMPGEVRGFVGAADLVRSTDGWWYEAWSEGAFAAGDTNHVGTMNFAWPDGPAGPGPDWAAIANQIATQQHANLQAASGVPHLLAAAARLRYLSTPPTVSESVDGATSSDRSPVAESDVTASSAWIFPGGAITAPARLQHCKARGHAVLKLQHPDRAFQFNYRIRLLTVDSRRQDAWVDRGYVGHVWTPLYSTATGDDRNRRLAAETRPDAVLWSTTLHDGHSQREGTETGETSLVVADSFDWYLPTKRLFYTDIDDVGVGLSAIRALNTRERQWSPEVSVHLRDTRAAGLGPAPRQTMGINSSFLSNIAVDGSVPHLEAVLDEPAFDGGERRWAKTEENVHLSWRTTWSDGELTVEIDGDPEDRSLQLWIVVEEDVFSGESVPDGVDVTSARSMVTQIHSAFPVEIVNQVMLVPDQFFRREREALEEGEALWYDLLDEYAISEGPSVVPVPDLYAQVHEHLQGGLDTPTITERLARLFALAHEIDPPLLEGLMADRGMEVDVETLARFR